ncbi:MAG: hypothetical protein LBC77_04060 [Spirochaetaceae bacterium]|jgi:hypothetical protein|nr:hypothetical protein [Spirochaetaceae bacterium]
MDINLLFSGSVILVTVTAFIVTTSVLVSVTRADFKDFKNLVENRFAAVDVRFTEMENRFEGRFVEMEGRFEGRFTEMEGRFEGRFTEMEGRLNRLEVDVAEIKAICRERTGRDTPV